MAAAFTALAAAAGGCQILAGLGGEEPLGSGAGGSGGTGGTTTSSGGSGGTGLTGPCTPAQTESCYSGATGTEGKGACKAGISTCRDDSTWGACEGEVLPQPESCGKAGDEDCNEVDCTVWTKILLGEVYAEAVAVDPKGNVYAAVVFSAGVDFGDGTPVVPIGGTDIALLKYDASGTLLWKKPIPAAGDQQIGAMAVDADGNIAIGGNSNGMIDFGTGKLEPGAFVARLDTAGSALWARSGQGPQTPSVGHVAMDSLGNVFIGGNTSAIDFGTGMLTSGDNQSFFVGKLAAATGEPQWVKITKGGAVEVISGMAVDPSNSLVVAGSWSSMFLGLAGQEAAPNDMYNCCGNVAPFLLRLDPDGAMSDSSMLAGYQSSLDVSIHDMDVDKFGVTTMVGSFSGKADFQSMTYDFGADNAAFVLHDQTSGFMQWSQAYPVADGFLEADHVAVDGADHIAMGGRYSGIVSFGGETLPEGESPVFVSKLDKDGLILWTRPYQLGDGNIVGMAAGSLENETVVIGTFYGSADFGTGTVDASQGTFLVKLGQ